MIVGPVQATDLIIHCMKAKLTCMLSGSPGLGKSDIVKMIAKQFNLELIDIRLSTCDPTELSGFPMIQTDGTAGYTPMNIFPLENTPIPKGKAGWLLFADEMTAAPLAVQSAAYRLILDRQVGQHNLHPNTAVIAAGNLSTDGAITNRLSTAMQSRLVHLELTVVPAEWLAWGAKNKIDHRVLAYIDHVPENLHKFDPRHDDKTFCCPRTWHFISRLIAGVPNEELGSLQALLAGTVGIAAATEFVAFTQIYSKLPTYKEIIANPLNAPLDKDPSMLFAVSHMIAAYLNKADITQGMKYIDRLPDEFQTITLQNLMSREPKLKDEKDIQKWCIRVGSELL